ncbi:MAG TPA: helix-turn-helix domain-containing protein [Puia sp.]|nr:helix-turn-helix domain-containing protein [Puia sp.]
MQKPVATPISNKHHLRPDRPDPVQVAYFLTESPERLSLPVRKNDHFVIAWFIKGSGYLTVDLSAYPIRADSLFIIHPHSDCSLDTTEDTDLEGWSLSIKEDYLHQAGSNLLGLIFGLRNISQFPVPKVKGEKLEQLFYFLQTELRAKSPDSDPVINAYLTILLSEFNDLSASSSEDRSLHDPRYGEFLDLVNKEFREIRDVETFAARIHISSKQLNRICKEASGRTASQLLDMRIHLEASRLLHYSTRSVKEISYDLGFGQPSYFIKFYRRISNQTPHQYRQLMSEKEHETGRTYKSRDMNLLPYYHN